MTEREDSGDGERQAERIDRAVERLVEPLAEEAPRRPS